MKGRSHRGLTSSSGPSEDSVNRQRQLGLLICRRKGGIIPTQSPIGQKSCNEGTLRCLSGGETRIPVLKTLGRKERWADESRPPVPTWSLVFWSLPAVFYSFPSWLALFLPTNHCKAPTPSQVTKVVGGSWYILKSALSYQQKRCC